MRIGTLLRLILAFIPIDLVHAADPVGMLIDADFQLRGITEKGCNIVQVWGPKGTKPPKDSIQARRDASIICFGPPPLFIHPASKADSETYRFWWDRSFHPTITLLLTRLPDGSGSLVAEVEPKKESPLSASEPVKRTETTIAATDMAILMTKLEASPFWHAKSSDVPPPNGDYLGCYDGAMWSLEGVRDSHHRIATVHACGGGSWLVSLGIDFLNAAQKEIPDLPVKPVY